MLGGADLALDLVAGLVGAPVSGQAGGVAGGPGGSPASARSIFSKMKAEVPAYQGAEWGRPAPLVQLRFAHSRG